MPENRFYLIHCSKSPTSKCSLLAQIRVVDSQTADSTDLSFLEGSSAKKKGQRAAELGFKNTALLSGTPPVPVGELHVTTNGEGEHT